MSSEGSSLLFKAIPVELRFQPDEKRELRRFTKHLSKRVADGRSFCCLLTNDETLRKLNSQFRQLDQPTDVLSFPVNSYDGDIGELAISVERAAAQAQRYGHGLLDEVRILMLHGVLHLAGMDHQRDRGEMARAERKLRVEFGLPNGLIGRTLPNGLSGRKRQ
jgi:probable rRNA maturation factor